MTYSKKPIEVALPLDTISRETAREKSIRHGNRFTFHLSFLVCFHPVAVPTVAIKDTLCNIFRTSTELGKIRRLKLA